MKNPKLQGTSPELKRRFGAAPLFGNPPFITQTISRSGSLRSRAGDRAKQPSPGQILSASLRLCVEIDALKTQRRKDAKSQRIQPTCARRRTTSDRHPTLRVASQTGEQTITMLCRTHRRVPVRWSALVVRRRIHPPKIRSFNTNKTQPSRKAAINCFQSGH